MTHSRDTSTPAMSAETVPSEEFVLVPKTVLAPFSEMAGELFALNFTNDMQAVCIWVEAKSLVITAGQFFALRRALAAAPNLSASHLAKEGGEAGAVERLKDAIEGECEGLAVTDEQAAAILAHVGLPQPSPTLAKGGDAEAIRLAETALDWSYDSAAFFAVATLPNGEKVPVNSLAEQSRVETVYRAALSTPTEGPASQTEGMGGDATKLRENIEAFLEMHRRGVLTPRTPNIPIELLQKALAALTQPETAEAVPPLYLIRKGGAFYRPNSQGYTRSIAEAGRYSLAEAEAITHPNGPNGPRDGMDYIPAPALASDPAPATDDRELEEETALRVGAIDRMKDAERERDDAAKALESVTEELGLFRDFVINNATVWTLGSNHHHPIWARVAARLEGYTSPRDGEKWHLVRSTLATEASR